MTNATNGKVATFKVVSLPIALYNAIKEYADRNDKDVSGVVKTFTTSDAHVEFDLRTLPESKRGKAPSILSNVATLLAARDAQETGSVVYAILDAQYKTAVKRAANVAKAKAARESKKASEVKTSK